VLGPSVPGPIVLIVDCPTLNHAHNLFSLPPLNCYYKESSKVVNCIIHLGPSIVTSNAEYKQWMRRFGEAQHLMAGHEM
jgi:ribonuclease Z